MRGMRKRHVVAVGVVMLTIAVVFSIMQTPVGKRIIDRFQYSTVSSGTTTKGTAWRLKKDRFGAKKTCYFAIRFGRKEETITEYDEGGAVRLSFVDEVFDLAGDSVTVVPK